MGWNIRRPWATLPPLKRWLTLAVLLCFAFGLAEGFACRAGFLRSCGHACGRAAPSKIPCGGRQAAPDPAGACCACCPYCFATSLPAPGQFWIRFTVGRRPADPGWRALERHYPPPLPPPRAAGQAAQVT
jgi:hypothetical protein